MAPVTPTAIPTVAPVLRLVGVTSVVGVISALRVVGVLSVLGVVCVMIPDEKDEKIILSNDLIPVSESLKVSVECIN